MPVYACPNAGHPKRVGHRCVYMATVPPARARAHAHAHGHGHTLFTVHTTPPHLPNSGIILAGWGRPGPMGQARPDGAGPAGWGRPGRMGQARPDGAGPARWGRPGPMGQARPDGAGPARWGRPGPMGQARPDGAGVRACVRACV